MVFELKSLQHQLFQPSCFEILEVESAKSQNLCVYDLACQNREVV